MALDVLPLAAPATVRSELSQAATAFERATRSRIAADLDSTRALRRSLQSIWRGRPQDRDGTGLAMLLDVTLTAVAFALHWHRTRQHAQQEAAAEQTLAHLQAAYNQVAEPVLTQLAQHTPSHQAHRRYAHHLQQATPEQAERILNDPAWDALATVLAQAEAAGHNTATVLTQDLGQRTLDDARSPARALTWRIRRLSERHAPSPRAQAANVRSTAQRLGAPASASSTVPLQQRVPARRR